MYLIGFTELSGINGAHFMVHVVLKARNSLVLFDLFDPKWLLQELLLNGPKTGLVCLFFVEEPQQGQSW